MKFVVLNLECLRVLVIIKDIKSITDSEFMHVDVMCLFLCLCLLVPDEFMYNPVTRSYGEPHKRPEVQNATVEFIASSDYMVCVCIWVRDAGCTFAFLFV